MPCGCEAADETGETEVAELKKAGMKLAARSDRLFREGAKRALELSNEEYEKLAPGAREMMRAVAMTDLVIVATVVETDHCFINEVGDRYVIEPNGKLDKEASSDVCMLAVGNMLPQIFMIVDRMVSGADPGGIFYDRVRCPDTGVDCHGVGKAVFEFSVEKAT